MDDTVRLRYIAFLKTTRDCYEDLKEQLGEEFEPWMAFTTAEIILLQETSKKPGGITFNMAAMLLLSLPAHEYQDSEAFQLAQKMTKAAMYYHHLNKQKIADAITEITP